MTVKYGEKANIRSNNVGEEARKTNRAQGAYLIHTTECVLARTRLVKAEYRLALVGCIP